MKGDNQLDKDLYIEVGKIWHKERIKREISLDYVAEKVGVSKMTISRYEKGNTRFNISMFSKINRVLGLDDSIVNKLARTKTYIDYDFTYDEFKIISPSLENEINNKLVGANKMKDKLEYEHDFTLSDLEEKLLFSFRNASDRDKKIILSLLDINDDNL